MDQVKVEAFLSVPPCSGGVALKKLLDEIQQDMGDKVEMVIYKGRHPLMEEYNLTAAPAVVIGGLVRVMGLCPSRESLIGALREAGLE